MFDWDEGDRFSFEDSERFEEDSLCSWMSEPESVCNNWRGWKKFNNSGIGFSFNNPSSSSAAHKQKGINPWLPFNLFLCPFVFAFIFRTLFMAFICCAQTSCVKRF